MSGDDTGDQENGTGRRKRPFPLLLLLLLLGLLGWWSLPHLIRALPSPVRYRLPDPLLALVTTPVPTALPAPTRLRPAPTIVLPTLAPSPTPTLPPTFTPPPTSVMVTAVPTPAPSHTPSPTLTATPLPPTVFIEGIGSVPQHFNNCGPANLTQVLNFYGVDVTQQDVAAAIRPAYDDRNVSPWEIVAYVQQQTSLQAATFVGGDLPLLQRLLAAGFPVIVEQGLVLADEDTGWMGHYLTLFGYDAGAQQFWALDTFLGPFDSVGRREDFAPFAQYWRHFNNRFVLIYPVEAETAVLSLLGPAFADPLIMWQTSAEAAQTAITTSPADPYAWFNLGSSLTHLGQLTGEATYFEQAAASFDEARRIGLPWRMLWYQFEPYEAYLRNGRYDDVFLLTDALLATEGGRYVEENFLYRGLAYQMQGDTARARSAYARGLEINPSHAELLAAQAMLPAEP
ncbi:MAG: C39 family peptidase [Ardenticatenaceae bacterium]|nr:C39 family peptidase [Anaerolineales bacterium]MCB8921177.1 C39 family peptidase [Ardenticatenaceae bacterium]MCB8990879.1 C39 family peptidase [Ardenticatenaceae bacterium]